MSNSTDRLAALERLAALRQSGQISQADFEQHKALLFANDGLAAVAGRSSSSWKWVGGIVVVLSLAVGTFLLARGDGFQDVLNTQVASVPKANAGSTPDDTLADRSGAPQVQLPDDIVDRCVSVMGIPTGFRVSTLLERVQRKGTGKWRAGKEGWVFAVDVHDQLTNLDHVASYELVPVEGTKPSAHCSTYQPQVVLTRMAIDGRVFTGPILLNMVQKGMSDIIGIDARSDAGREPADDAQTSVSRYDVQGVSASPLKTMNGGDTYGRGAGGGLTTRMVPRRMATIASDSDRFNPCSQRPAVNLALGGFVYRRKGMMSDQATMVWIDHRCECNYPLQMPSSCHGWCDRHMARSGLLRTVSGTCYQNAHI